MTTKNQLPEVITSFINALNAHDGDTFIACFAKDAHCNDFQRNFWGVEEIKKWSDKEMIGDRVTFQIDEAIEHYGEYFITALTDGNYDKKLSPHPTYLDYFFTLCGNKIVRLLITKNRAKSAK
jgi:hypothetical protein